jgi:hypothetical protein
MWSAAALAALFAAWRVWRLVAVRVNVAVATTYVTKLVRAGNLERAQKLCAAAPRSIYLAAVRTALADPADARARFDEEFAKGLAPLESSRWMDLTALAAGTLTVVIAATTANVSVPALVIGGAAAMAALSNIRWMRHLRRDPVLAFPTIVEALAASSPTPTPPPTRPRTPIPIPTPTPTPVRPPAPAGDLRSGTCPLCGGGAIAQRAPVAGDLVPWVCEGCGYAQLFAAR